MYKNTMLLPKSSGDVEKEATGSRDVRIPVVQHLFQLSSGAR